MNRVKLIASRRVRDAYLAACALDVAALKPGNVSAASAGHGMTGDDFHRSALASADAVSDATAGLGQRVQRAVAATHAAVGMNTNLGIVLLCAPLAEAALQTTTERPLRSLLREVLQRADVQDAEGVFAAVRIANPGGLGDAAEHDVARPAQVGLRDAMAAAADRDHIAGLYASGFADLFDDALPHLSRARGLLGNTHAAVTDLYLHLLSRYPDSHVRRKFGAEAAAALREQAAEVYDAWRVARAGSGDGATSERGADGDPASALLWAFDARLKSAGINPGTTADMTVATLFLERLQLAAAHNPGVLRRITWRQLRLASSGAPLISTLLVGES
jgi:triphosphoribosyl-dephospho-CoA synthase